MATLPHWFLLSCVGVLGAIWGSFVAALCSRWPKRESVATGRSRCDGCQQTIAAYDLIPIFSYLFLRGKCRNCGGVIGRDAIMIEIVAVMAGAAPFLFLAPGQALAFAILGWLLLPLIILDQRHLWLPNRLVLLLTAGGVFFGPLLIAEVTAFDRLLGALGAYLVLQSVRLLFFAIRKIEGMGAGDPKLFAALGVWLGWQPLPLVLLLASVIGLVWALFLTVMHRRAVREVAFGNMLALAALVWAAGNALFV